MPEQLVDLNKALAIWIHWSSLPLKHDDPRYVLCMEARAVIEFHAEDYLRKVLANGDQEQPR